MYYIYQFLNKAEKPIYIGITANIKKRINIQHFGGNGHLPDECYEEAYIVLYSKCLSKDDAKIKERYFINKLNPKYNSMLNNNSSFGFTIDDLKWIYLPIDKDKFYKKIFKNRNNNIKNINLKHDNKSYKSLKKGNFKFFKKIPFRATELYHKKDPFGDIHKLSILSINNVLYTFNDQIHRIFDGSMNSQGTVVNTINLINNSFIDIDECCIISDDYLIKENLISPSSTAALVAVDSVKNILKCRINELFEPYVKKLEKKKVLKYRIFYEMGKSEDLFFYTIDEFIEFSKKNIDYLGQRFKAAKKINSLLKPFTADNCSGSECSTVSPPVS
jgi:predicted GIY-YIG superfamily endonuclease